MHCFLYGSFTLSVFFREFYINLFNSFRKLVTLHCRHNAERGWHFSLAVPMQDCKFTENPTHKEYVCGNVAVSNRGNRPQSFHLWQDRFTFQKEERGIDKERETVFFLVRQKKNTLVFIFVSVRNQRLAVQNTQNNAEGSFFILLTVKCSLDPVIWFCIFEL